MAAGPSEAWPELAATEVDLDEGEVVLTLQSGRVLRTQLGWAGECDAPPAGVPVIYLDQRHWITLAQQLHSPERVSVEERDAAQALIQKAQSAEVILPISAAHIVETAPWGRHRRDLAFTMIELSRGWQMRNPLGVRRQEIQHALAGDPPGANAVITLEPDVALTNRARVQAPSDFPPAFAEVYWRLTSITANIATMLEEAEHPSAGPGPEAAQRWAQTYGALATAAHQDRLSRGETRIRAHNLLMTDLREEIEKAAAEAEASPMRLAGWLRENSEEDLGAAPAIGSLREVLYHRLRNPSDRWEPNDLVDMTFLSCATGYADAVVAEKKFADYLRRAEQGGPRNGEVVSRLRDLTAMR